jgi:ribosomal protein S12 methylthiotransferase
MADFVAERKFERLGVFTYSIEPDTPAAKLADHLPDDLKNARRDEIMRIQRPIAEAFNATLIGRELDVLIDGRAPGGGDDLWLGRTYADAPDVDGVVLARGPGLRPGDVVPCEILETEGYDFVARTTALPTRRKRPRPRPRSRPGSSLTILEGI